MRNAMLTVLGKLVMNLLTGDNLDQNQKNMREEFIDTLCEHLHDCNGFVRAKVCMYPSTSSRIGVITYICMRMFSLMFGVSDSLP